MILRTAFFFVLTQMTCLFSMCICIFSACYIPIDAIAGAGDVVVAAEGKGPLDDKGEYGGNRRRWGDYSAAAVDGNEVTFVSNIIESR